MAWQGRAGLEPSNAGAVAPDSVRLLRPAATIPSSFGYGEAGASNRLPPAYRSRPRARAVQGRLIPDGAAQA